MRRGVDVAAALAIEVTRVVIVRKRHNITTNVAVARTGVVVPVSSPLLPTEGYSWRKFAPANGPGLVLSTSRSVPLAHGLIRWPESCS